MYDIYDPHLSFSKWFIECDTPAGWFDIQFEQAAGSSVTSYTLSAGTGYFTLTGFPVDFVLPVVVALSDNSNWLVLTQDSGLYSLYISDAATAQLALSDASRWQAVVQDAVMWAVTVSDGPVFSVALSDILA